jgi:Golgi complex component 7 (COG7)
MSINLEHFTSESFNPITYLNQILPPSNPDTYYTSATSLLPTLELLARNTHEDLNIALSTLLRSSTRLGIDMDTLTHDSRSLASQIPQVQEEVLGLQLESGAMSELSLLEVVQDRMQQTANTFKKAGQWTPQVDETIHFQIESGGFEVAETRIAELRELLGVWEGTNEFKERADRIFALDRALTSARAPVAVQTSPYMQRGSARPQSRLRMDSSEAVLRESGGLFGQIRQNIGR